MKLNDLDLKCLELIRTEEDITRKELSKKLDISLAAITKKIKKLDDLNIVKENISLDSGGGRPIKTLVLNDNDAKIIGINLGTEFIKIGIGNFSNEFDIVTEKSFYFKKKEKIFSLLVDCIKEVIGEINDKKVIGIGIALHGTVNSEKGVSLYSPHFKWENFDVKKEIEKIFGIPTFVENDVRSIALVEIEKHNNKNFILMYIRNGLGGTIVLDGKIHSGIHSSAGEIGHIVVDENSGRRCNCGKYGCLEAEVSEKAIVEKIQWELGKSEDLREEKSKLDEIGIQYIFEEALKGNYIYQNIIKDSGYLIGKTLGIALNILDIENVILVGNINKTKKILYPEIKKGIERNIMKTLNKDINLKEAELESTGAILGSFLLVKRNLFKNEKIIFKIIN